MLNLGEFSDITFLTDFEMAENLSEQIDNAFDCFDAIMDFSDDYSEEQKVPEQARAKLKSRIENQMSSKVLNVKKKMNASTTPLVKQLDIAITTTTNFSESTMAAIKKFPKEILIDSEIWAKAQENQDLIKKSAVLLKWANTFVSGRIMDYKKVEQQFVSYYKNGSAPDMKMPSFSKETMHTKLAHAITDAIEAIDDLKRIKSFLQHCKNKQENVAVRAMCRFLKSELGATHFQGVSVDVSDTKSSIKDGIFKIIKYVRDKIHCLYALLKRIQDFNGLVHDKYQFGVNRGKIKIFLIPNGVQKELIELVKHILRKQVTYTSKVTKVVVVPIPKSGSTTSRASGWNKGSRLGVAGKSIMISEHIVMTKDAYAVAGTIAHEFTHAFDYNSKIRVNGKFKYRLKHDSHDVEYRTRKQEKRAFGVGDKFKDDYKAGKIPESSKLIEFAKMIKRKYKKDNITDSSRNMRMLKVGE